jgi:hypothetical protein
MSEERQQDSFLRRLVGHNDRAGAGQHAADAVADRDPGTWDLGGGGAAHLAHALLQCVHAVHAGMHVGKTAAIGVERDPRAAGPAGRRGDAGGSIAFGDETAG